MRHEAKLKNTDPERNPRIKAKAPRWSYEIDFRRADIRRRMLEALDLQP